MDVVLVLMIYTKTKYCMLKSLIFSNSASSRNLGAYRIAHILRQHNWDIEVIDFFSCWSREEIEQILMQRVDSKTRFIGVGTLFLDEAAIPYWFFDLIKENYPDVTTIFGSQVKSGIDYKNIDYTLSGWADHSILILLKYLFSNGEIPMFEEQNYTKNIDSITSYPAFPLESLTVLYEDRDYIEPWEALTVEFARGCKFKCKFCNFPVLGVKGDYSRSEVDFEHQLRDAYDRFGVKKYIVADETFNDSTQKIIKYADVVEKLPFTPWFTGFIRADLLVSHSSQLEHLARMNFAGQYYGIESFNYLSAKSVGKGMHPDKIKDVLLKTEKYFEANNAGQYRGTIGLIIGLPHETEKTLDLTIEWLKINWQKQSFNPYVLEIPLSKKDNNSIFGRDYASYGYQKYDNLTAEQDSMVKSYLRSEAAGISRTPLIWKNSELDFIKAIKIYNNWSLIVDQCRFGNFELFHFKKVDFNSSRNNFYEDQSNNFLTQYKQKKLNYI